MITVLQPDVARVFVADGAAVAFAAVADEGHTPLIVITAVLGETLDVAGLAGAENPVAGRFTDGADGGASVPCARARLADIKIRKTGRIVFRASSR